jgi:hypothetical protein
VVIVILLLLIVISLIISSIILLLLFIIIIITKPTFSTNQLYTTPTLGLEAKGQRAGGVPKAVKLSHTVSSGCFRVSVCAICASRIG